MTLANVEGWLAVFSLTLSLCALVAIRRAERRLRIERLLIEGEATALAEWHRVMDRWEAALERRAQIRDEAFARDALALAGAIGALNRESEKRRSRHPRA
jgi:hypothetical protein